MLKPYSCLLVLSGALLQVSHGTLMARQLFPSCTGTGLPNFSYATGVRSSNATGGTPTPCTALITTPPRPSTITWFYYDSYPVADCDGVSDEEPVGDCGALDSCCHSTATSTITFTSSLTVVGLVEIVQTSTGTVTAGQFLGQNVSWVQTTTLGPNCGTAYGQESAVSTIDFTTTGGIACENGGQLSVACPGQRPLF